MHLSCYLLVFEAEKNNCLEELSVKMETVDFDTHCRLKPLAAVAVGVGEVL